MDHRNGEENTHTHTYRLGMLEIRRKRNAKKAKEQGNISVQQGLVDTGCNVTYMPFYIYIIYKVAGVTERTLSRVEVRCLLDGSQ